MSVINEHQLQRVTQSHKEYSDGVQVATVAMLEARVPHTNGAVIQFHVNTYEPPSFAFLHRANPPFCLFSTLFIPLCFNSL